MPGFRFNEKYLSQIPALQMLMNMGYQYLPTEEVQKQRQGKCSHVILEDILREQLKAINHISYKGNTYLFSEENIQSAIQKLKNIKQDNLLKTNEEIYDLITLGESFPQTIEGDLKSHTLHYIDWNHPEQNVYHVAAEFVVERSRSTETARPDIVLFINGIPMVVIECKSPNIGVDEAVSQSIRNQHEEYIPRLFSYAQLVVAINKNDARYATVGASKKFWNVWKEDIDEKRLLSVVNTPLSSDQKQVLFTGDFELARSFFDNMEKEGQRLSTEQDKALFALCRPERLLELIYKYTIFDGGTKKIARYQQYFVIKAALGRIKNIDPEGKRQGGIIWHTQGSGKSLTMVMLTRNMALDPEISNPRIVLVTDRDDLDKQLSNTFAACGFSPNRATSGRHLLDLVAIEKAAIVTTLIHKFDKALNVKKFQDESSDIFMLVDESHRSNFGSFAARMRQMFPNACYIGFSGTPLMKKEKNNFIKFGGLIEPHYSINQAVEDGAVVPLLYEGRMVELKQDKEAIDLWFERHTQGLSNEQKADLKRKYARAEMLNKADQVIYTRAFDISEHFRSTWQGSGFKAQLVAPSKAAALKYYEYLKELGHVSSEVMISPPNMRESFDETDDDPTDEVVKFWDKMMKRYGKEDEYTKQIINQFKFGDDPEILIVVSKLLTGFDAPRNTVIYICKELREHNLLQAIARVNRIYENKEYGHVIDYVGLLGELDKALTMYGALEGFEEQDISGALHSVKEAVNGLPQKYSDLWDLFKEIKNTYDEEAYEVLLGDKEVRDEFYERLADYSKALHLALSTEFFVMSEDEAQLERYKNTLKRFQKLKAAVKFRYQEAIDYRDYEPKIKKLLDTHIQANEVIQLHAPINIFDNEMFDRIREDLAEYDVKTNAAKADAIANATKKVITEKMEEDPAFYEKFSKLIQDVIEEFRLRRISDMEYLKRASEIRNKVVTRQHDDVPDRLKDNDEAMAFYGVLKDCFDGKKKDGADVFLTDIAVATQEIFNRNWKVHFWDDDDAKNATVDDIEDYLLDEIRDRAGVSLTYDEIDEMIEKIMNVARARRKS